MKHEDELTEFESRARVAFDAQVAATEANARARLAQAREQALAAAPRSAWSALTGASRWWMPVGGVAALLLIIVTSHTVIQTRTAMPEINATSAVEDIDILAAADDLELLQDVDFYDSLEAVEASDNEVG